MLKRLLLAVIFLTALPYDLMGATPSPAAKSAGSIIADDNDAKNRCPTVCKNNGGQWTDRWAGNSCFCYKIKDKVLGYMIYDDSRSKAACEKECGKDKWKGRWHTIPYEKKAVCSCIVSW